MLDRDSIQGLIARVASGEGRWEAPNSGRREWRRRLPDGTYEYREAPPEERKHVVKHDQQNQPVTPDRNHVYLDRPMLERTLTRGFFTMVSAGRNPNSPKEKDLDPYDDFFHQRHLQLKEELNRRGLKYTEALGKYGSKEPMFLVFHDRLGVTPRSQKGFMVHHASKESAAKTMLEVEQIGKMFNQDSVLHGVAGDNRVVFTTGEKKGKTCGGKGWKEMAHARDFYTDIKLADRKHSKFQLDISGCFEQGLL